MKTYRKRVSVIIVHQDRILAFRAEDPASHRKYVFLPGGAPEEGETLLNAALRETMEETGFEVDLNPDPVDIRQYDFEWNGQLYDCETYYFKGRLKHSQQQPVDDASYHQGVVWVAKADVTNTFGYHQAILEPVKKVIRQQA